MLKELYDATGRSIGHHLHIEGDTNTIFLRDFGYIRDVNGTDLARVSMKEQVGEDEECWHFDLVGHSEVVSHVYKMLEGVFEMDDLVSYLMAEALEPPRYMWSRHNCGLPLEECNQCKEIEHIVEQDQAFWDIVGDDDDESDN